MISPGPSTGLGADGALPFPQLGFSRPAREAAFSRILSIWSLPLHPSVCGRPLPRSCLDSLPPGKDP